MANTEMALQFRSSHFRIWGLCAFVFRFFGCKHRDGTQEISHRTEITMVANEEPIDLGARDPSHLGVGVPPVSPVAFH